MEKISRAGALGWSVDIEDGMAQHRTRRTTAKAETQITPEQQDAARVWLESTLHTEPPAALLEQLDTTSPALPLPAVVEALSTMVMPEAAALLTHIASKTEGKDLQKAARRALYRLKAMGVDIEHQVSREPRRSVLEVPKLPVVAALASQIDFDGNRALYLARRRPFSGLVFVSLIINDQRGIIECNAFPVTKKDLGQMIADIQADDRLTHGELPPTYAQQLVEASYQRNLSTGTPVPQAFQGLRDLIGRPDTLWDKPPIYHVLPSAEIRSQPSWLTQASQLLGVKEFQGWHLPPAVVQGYREEIKRASDSPLIVSQALQQERIETVQKRTVREIFDVEHRAQYRARLEEMAYLLWQTKRPDDAKRALASALALEGEEIDPAGHPFLLGLFARSIEMAEAQEQQDTNRVTVAAPRLWTP